jgi:hypothetical protein
VTSPSQGLSSNKREEPGNEVGSSEVYDTPNESEGKMGIKAKK